MSAYRLQPLAFWACLLAVLSSLAPLGAQTNAAATYDEAIEVVTLELAYRQELAAFESRIPPQLLQLPSLHDIDNLAADVALAELEAVDAVRGPAALEALIQHNVVVIPPLRAVLSSGVPLAPSGLDYLPYVRSDTDLVVARVALDARDLDVADDRFDLFALLPAGSIDRGTPPDVLVQGDTEVGGVSEGFSFSPDPIELLSLAAVGVILLGLLTMLVTSRQRQASRAEAAAGPSSQEFLEASRAIHAVDSVETLCQAAAERARSITRARSAMVTIDGMEGAAGDWFEVPPELVFRANREVRLVSRRSLHAMPVSISGTVIGLLVIDGGRQQTLEVFASLVEDGYESVSARARTAALAFVDGLTGIANRRRFDQDLDHAMGVATATETPVAVAMFDVDHFNGESSQPSGTVALSVGIASAPAGDGSTLVHAADSALYEAKTAGRNSVVIEAPLT